MVENIVFFDAGHCEMMWKWNNGKKNFFFPIKINYSFLFEKLILIIILYFYFKFVSLIYHIYSKIILIGIKNNTYIWD